MYETTEMMENSFWR